DSKMSRHRALAVICSTSFKPRTSCLRCCSWLWTPRIMCCAATRAPIISLILCIPLSVSRGCLGTMARRSWSLWSRALLSTSTRLISCLSSASTTLVLLRPSQQAS
ncbi:hypothetical protein GGI00_006876, partial [Coemansia sp. RSA 2681]